mmetsp:Transcript_6912/g.15090  ORF Transcript_6912/g.15090 Transcript_6912/m.15090 type:complete len:576 (-) Transcript_6912:772-2499(-)
MNEGGDGIASRVGGGDVVGDVPVSNHEVREKGNVYHEQETMIRERNEPELADSDRNGRLMTCETLDEGEVQRSASSANNNTDPYLNEDESRRVQQYSKGDAAATWTSSSLKDQPASLTQHTEPASANTNCTTNNDNENSNHFSDNAQKMDLDSLIKIPEDKAFKHSKFPPGCPVVYYYDTMANGDICLRFGKVRSVRIAQPLKYVYGIPKRNGEREEMELFHETSLAFARNCPIVYKPTRSSAGDGDKRDDNDDGHRRGVVASCRKIVDDVEDVFLETGKPSRGHRFVYSILLKPTTLEEDYYLEKHDVEQEDISFDWKRHEERRNASRGNNHGGEKCKAGGDGEDDTIQPEGGKEGEAEENPPRANKTTVSRNNDDDNGDEKVPNGKLISSVDNGQLIQEENRELFTTAVVDPQEVYNEDAIANSSSPDDPFETHNSVQGKNFNNGKDCSPNKQNTKVLVHNLGLDVDMHGLRMYFATFGNIVNLQFPLRLKNSPLCNLAMIEFDSLEASSAIVKKKLIYSGRKLGITYFDEKSNLSIFPTAPTHETKDVAKCDANGTKCKKKQKSIFIFSLDP